MPPTVCICSESCCVLFTCCLHVVYMCVVFQVAKPLDVKTKFMNVEVCVHIDYGMIM